MSDEQITAHEGRRLGVVVSVRLKPDEADLLEFLSERDGRTMSETLQIALHNYAAAPAHGPSIALKGELGPHSRGDARDALLVNGS
jgi:hypothetical protein